MGVMESCSRGAKEAGGIVIGVTCSAVFSRRTPNPYLTEIDDQPDLPARIVTLIRMADAYVVLDGNIGTLAELFLAWNVVATGWIKPLIVVGSALKAGLNALTEYTEIDDKQLSLISFVETVDEAAGFLRSYFN